MMDEIDITKLIHLSETPRQMLLNELLAYQRKKFNELSDTELRANVVTARVVEYQERLMKEAGISQGPFGYVVNTDDTD